MQQTFGTSGGFDTLLLMFPSGDGGLGLLRVESADWSFYEVEISRVEIWRDRLGRLPRDTLSG